jgi:hypothetical protein
MNFGAGSSLSGFGFRYEYLGVHFGGGNVKLSHFFYALLVISYVPLSLYRPRRTGKAEVRTRKGD